MTRPELTQQVTFLHTGNLAETAVCRTGARLLQLLTWTIAGMPPANNIAGALQKTWAPYNDAVTNLLNAALVLFCNHSHNSTPP